MESSFVYGARHRHLNRGGVEAKYIVGHGDCVECDGMELNRCCTNQRGIPGGVLYISETCS